MDQVTFDYIKSPHFRVIHADGVMGSTGPGEYLRFSLFSERYTIPKSITCKLNADGSLGAETGRDARSSQVIRELEAFVVMDITTAHEIYRWLAASLGKDVQGGLATPEPELEEFNPDTK